MYGKRSLGLSILLLFVLGCSLFSPPPMDPAPITPIPNIMPEAIAEENTDNTPLVLNTHLPNGVVTEQNGLITVFDSDGYTILQTRPPNINASNIHIASSLSAESTSLPLFYYSFEQNYSIFFYNAGQVATLRSVPFFAGLIGAEGYPFIAYTTAEFADDALISDLYVGTPDSLPTAASLLNDVDPKGWALSALYIDVIDGKVEGIWYAKQPWGIGGDIVFQPRRTLSYLELSTGTAYQYLGAEANPSALSADREWVAYTNDTSVEAGGGAMSARNLESGEYISFPLLQVIDQRGAGNASFSPSNQYLAWMEASGSQMGETPNFHTVVRVGNLNGNVIAEFADTAFLTTSGLSTIQRVEPVGWFDDNTLVVMARGEHWDEAMLIAIDIPSQSMRLLARGVFVGFTYP